MKKSKYYLYIIFVLVFSFDFKVKTEQVQNKLFFNTKKQTQFALFEPVGISQDIKKLTKRLFKPGIFPGRYKLDHLSVDTKYAKIDLNSNLNKWLLTLNIIGSPIVFNNNTGYKFKNFPALNQMQFDFDSCSGNFLAGYNSCCLPLTDDKITSMFSLDPIWDKGYLESGFGFFSIIKPFDRLKVFVSSDIGIQFSLPKFGLKTLDFQNNSLLKKELSGRRKASMLKDEISIPWVEFKYCSILNYYNNAWHSEIGYTLLLKQSEKVIARDAKAEIANSLNTKLAAKIDYSFDKNFPLKIGLNCLFEFSHIVHVLDNCFIACNLESAF